MGLGNDLQQVLGLRRHPVSVGFFDHPPNGVEQWAGPAVPAGCSFWGKAMDGATFYTRPSDHYNCAVGCHTHNIPLPSERGEQLGETISLMVESGYLAMDEVPNIPTLPETPAFVAYGPVDEAPFEADVVILTCDAEQAMVLYEGALRERVGAMITPTLGRPTCAILPMTLESGAAALSLGCNGNRVFTGVRRGEMYLSVPGDQWLPFATGAIAALSANERMHAYYCSHQERIAAEAQR